MRASRATFAFAVMALANAQGNMPNIPLCALNCFVTTFTSDGCSSLTDFACHCTKPGIQDEITPCVKEACEAADQATVLRTIEDTCKSVGHPLEVTTSAPSPAVGAPLYQHELKIRQASGAVSAVPAASGIPAAPVVSQAPVVSGMPAVPIAPVPVATCPAQATVTVTVSVSAPCPVVPATSAAAAPATTAATTATSPAPPAIAPVGSLNGTSSNMTSVAGGSTGTGSGGASATQSVIPYTGAASIARSAPSALIAAIMAAIVLI